MFKYTTCRIKIQRMMDIDYILDIAARSISSKGRKKRNGGSIILFRQNEGKKNINLYEIDRD